MSAFFVRQLAALADATDEHMAIVRAADSEDLDAVQFKETCSAFLMNIHYLFHKARLWTAPHTYAAAMLHPDCAMWHVFYNTLKSEPCHLRTWLKKEPLLINVDGRLKQFGGDLIMEEMQKRVTARILDAIGS